MAGRRGRWQVGEGDGKNGKERWERAMAGRRGRMADGRGRYQVGEGDGKMGEGDCRWERKMGEGEGIRMGKMANSRGR